MWSGSVLVPQLLAQVVQRNPLEQHVPGIAVPQRVGPYTPPALCGPKDRLLHPPPDRHAGHFDQSALADDPETGGGHYTLYFGGPSHPAEPSYDFGACSSVNETPPRGNGNPTMH